MKRFNVFSAWLLDSFLNKDKVDAEEYWPNLLISFTRREAMKRSSPKTEQGPDSALW